MTQDERLNFLIEFLLNKYEVNGNNGLSLNEEEKKKLLRSLVNVRKPQLIKEEFIKIQDEFLRIENEKRGIVEAKKISTIDEEYSFADIPFGNRIALWNGDITRLKVDAIVNAANSKMLGCFVPCHGCIDNAIHSAAGIELRRECKKIMEEQGYDEPTGIAKITKAYNLPSKYIIHTVGPIVSGKLTEIHKTELRNCYVKCLECAVENGIKTIAFCCISTGEYGFPNKEAAEIAMETVMEFLALNSNKIELIVFNTFKIKDYEIYKDLIFMNNTKRGELNKFVYAKLKVYQDSK